LTGDSYRDPGYPLFLAGWMKIFPQWNLWYPAVLLSQGFLGTLSVVFALCLSRRWMPYRWLAAAGILMAIWPHSVSIGSFIMSESLSGFLCLLALLLLGKATDQKGVTWSVASGICFGLAALTNAILLPFAPIVGVYLAIRRYIGVSMLGALLAGAIILPAAWMTRNALLPPSPDASTTRALSTLVLGSWPHFYKDLQASLDGQPEGIAAIKLIDDQLDLVAANPKAGVDQLAKRMSAHPMKYAYWYLIGKPTLLWDWSIRIGMGDIYIYPTRQSPFENNAVYRSIIAICHTINYPIFIFMIFGVLMAFFSRERSPASLTAAALLLTYTTFIYSVLQAEPRYSVAYRPLEILLAIFAIHKVKSYLTSINEKHKMRKS
jgi:4-amino-4-deoxy-L-arabinose transferase-like glycosyltransferase